jgi:hypothetical protein
MSFGDGFAAYLKIPLDIVLPVQNFLQLPKVTRAGHPGDWSREGGGTE